MRRRHLILIRFALLAWLFTAAPWGRAADINTLQLLTQAEFRAFSEDLSAVASFKPMIPSESMGLTGFDIGAAVSGTRLENKAVWEKAAAGASVPSTLPVPMLRVHKGLPWNIDVGASLAKVPSTDITIVGGELRWAVLPGSTVLPAVALRASASALSGVDQLSFRSYGFDVSISKGFAFLTPYAGVGIVRSTSKPDAAALLANESFSQGKVFAGLNVNFGLANLLIETDKTGDATSYGVKVGFRF
jgi:hypothetical protein